MTARTAGARPPRDLALPAIVAGLLAIALVEPRVETAAPGTVALLLDASGSVPAPARERGARDLEGFVAGLPRAAAAAVFTFAGKPQALGMGPRSHAKEWLDEAAGAPPSWDGTDLGAAIDDAVRTVLVAGGGSIVVATDGTDLAGTGLGAARRASHAGVAVHVLPLERGAGPEVSLETLTVVSPGRKGQAFEVEAVVRSTVAQRARVAIERDGVPVAEDVAPLRAGAAHAFRFLLPSGDHPEIVSAVAEGEHDGDPGNNIARAAVPVGGAVRAGVIGGVGSTGAGVDRQEELPDEAALQRYDALLVAADSVASDGGAQERLAAFVRAGKGLLLACADPEVAASLRGGPLEAVLPVELAPPSAEGDEAAVVVLVDRSGSMDSRDGRTSALEVALDATTALAGLLEGGDRYGVVAFDVAPHVLRPLGPVEAGREAERPAAVAPEGGTDWGPALDLALDWLARDVSPRRHVILVSDGRLGEGASGEPRSPWPEGVTLSTVAVGSDADRAGLEALALRRGGRHVSVDGPADLPAALRREGARLRLPETAPGPVAAMADAGHAAVFPAVTARAPVLVVRPRDEATVAMSTEAGHPLLVFGEVGWGRSGFLAADPASLEVRRRGLPEGWRGLLAAALGRVAPAGEATSAMVVARDGARVAVEVLLDEATARLPTARLRRPSGSEETLPLDWDGPHHVAFRFVPDGAGEYLVDVGGERRRILVAVVPERTVLPFDPEWAARLAEAGGGEVLASGGGAGDAVLDAERRVRRDMTSGLVALAALVFFVDAARRTLRASPARRSVAALVNPEPEHAGRLRPPRRLGGA